MPELALKLFATGSAAGHRCASGGRYLLKGKNGLLRFVTGTISLLNGQSVRKRFFTFGDGENE